MTHFAPPGEDGPVMVAALWLLAFGLLAVACATRCWFWAKGLDGQQWADWWRS